MIWIFRPPLCNTYSSTNFMSIYNSLFCHFRRLTLIPYAVSRALSHRQSLRRDAPALRLRPRHCLTFRLIVRRRTQLFIKTPPHLSEASVTIKGRSWSLKGLGACAELSSDVVM